LKNFAPRKVFPSPPKSAPSLRLWLEDSKEAQLRKINKLSDLQQTYSHSNLIMSIHNLTTWSMSRSEPRPQSRRR